ncbi:MAG: hypothetical protein ACI4MH_04695 [Candidatus Coproplasma sp.]
MRLFKFREAKEQDKEEERKQAGEECVNNLIHTLEDVAGVCCINKKYENYYFELKRYIPLLKEKKPEEKAEIALTKLINNAADEAKIYFNCNYNVVAVMLVQEIVEYVEDWISGNTYYSNEVYSKVRLNRQAIMSKRNRLSYESDMLQKEYLKLQAESGFSDSESDGKDLRAGFDRRAAEIRSQIEFFDKAIGELNLRLQIVVREFHLDDKGGSPSGISVGEDDAWSDVIDFRR